MRRRELPRPTGAPPTVLLREPRLADWIDDDDRPLAELQAPGDRWSWLAARAASRWSEAGARWRAEHRTTFAEWCQHRQGTVR